jgi:hypothetical protein
MFYVVLRRNGVATLQGGYSLEFQAYAKAKRLRQLFRYAETAVKEMPC